jgi:hypothetical protein
MKFLRSSAGLQKTAIHAQWSDFQFWEFEQLMERFSSYSHQRQEFNRRFQVNLKKN